MITRNYRIVSCGDAKAQMVGDNYRGDYHAIIIRVQSYILRQVRPVPGMNYAVGFIRDG